jgi:putative MATE family efflux protein
MQQHSSARMGVMPIPRLILKISFPVMLSMTIQALYNIVDSIYVSRMAEKEQALSALQLAFPIQMLMIAIAVGTGVGINSLISRRLGEKRREEALKAATNGVFLAFVGWVVFALFGLFFSGIFMRAFTQDAVTLQMGSDYLRICTVYSLGIFVSIAIDRIMQSTGNTFYNMIVQITGAVLNIILDPIFIFGWGFVPAMGVKGAAIATVIGQVVSMILGFIFNQVKNKELRLHVRGFRPDWKTILEIYKVGLPSIIMQTVGSLMIMALNLILAALSAVAVAVMGLYFRLQSFVFMPVFGLTGGVVAIVGYNFGARNVKRVYEAVRVALLYAGSIMAVGTAVFLLFPGFLLSLFDATKEMLSVGIPALRIISLSFLMAAVGIILSTVFQAIGNGMLSLIVSLVRQLLVLLPAAYLLSRLGGLGAVWWSVPLAESVSLVLCVILYYWADKRYIRPLGELRPE